MRYTTAEADKIALGDAISNKVLLKSKSSIIESNPGENRLISLPSTLNTGSLGLTLRYALIAGRSRPEASFESGIIVKDKLLEATAKAPCD